MKKADLKRLLEVPDGFYIEYGGKHIKVLNREGKLLMVFSKSTRKIDEPSLRNARRKLSGAAA